MHGAVWLLNLKYWILIYIKNHATKLMYFKMPFFVIEYKKNCSDMLICCKWNEIDDSRLHVLCYTQDPSFVMNTIHYRAKYICI